jgi:CheY-like chemotaxis protein
MTRTVLAVDDDPFVLKTVERYLSPEGISVVTASSAEGALGRLARGGVDLVILDLHLPKIDGLDLCRRIKTDERTRAVPLLAMTTSCPDSPGRQRALDAGAEACVAKPFLRRTLLDSVRALLAEPE